MSGPRLRVCAILIALIGSVVGSVAVVAPASAAAPDPRADPARVTLAALRPSASQAPRDRPPVYTDGCHVDGVETRPTHCTYGNPRGTRVIVAIGDSHMANHFGALDGAARSAGWRLIWMTKSACPGQDASISSNGTYYRSCDSWRQAVLRKTRLLPRVDAVVLTGASRTTLLQRGTLRPIVGASAQAAAWRGATLRTIAALRGQAHRVIILRDTPNVGVEVPACLVARSGWTGNCSRSRAAALDTTRWQAERSATAVDAFARATELTDVLCSPDICRPVTSANVVRWRDSHHLTNTFSALTASEVKAKIAWHLAN